MLQAALLTVLGFEKSAASLLQNAQFNLDIVWPAALLAAGAATLFL
jgi:hypothetical protein